MATLLIRLAGPMQSWGCESKYDKRHTWRAPSKSGLLGFLSAALGIRRDESIEELQSLRFGVRIDREGTLLRDFQTTLENGKASHVIEKYYLSDAVFLVGLEGDNELLTQIDAALKHPFFPLYLGRRSCPTEGRVSLGLRNCSLEDALAYEPCLAAQKNAGKLTRLRILADTGDVPKSSYFLRDRPISFDPKHRQYGFRRVTEYSVPFPTAADDILDEKPTLHDPMAELEVNDVSFKN